MTKIDLQKSLKILSDHIGTRLSPKEGVDLSSSDGHRRIVQSSLTGYKIA